MEFTGFDLHHHEPHRLGNGAIVDSMVHDGLWCSFKNWHMGSAAEHIAREYKVSREAQDEYALGSQQKAAAAIEAGRFRNEILPVEVGDRTYVRIDSCHVRRRACRTRRGESPGDGT